ncbi:lysosomal alpha-mannosidase-like [Wyeomyia smithii]|uniref:lysosomal alpha-mannosidase-like n=1 Tax=Wyeomyia smithii TaxID=174621 RepID=UPI00246819FB|nr:lysosomal alpha-mannosidase-like [Wyeomyia smithii]
MRCFWFVGLLLLAVFVGKGHGRPGRNHRGGGSGTFVERHAEYGRNLQQVAKCGYESCPTPKRDMINVHLVPHSHDDVGWLKTVDQYYYGSKTNHQRAGVQYILDSVVDALLHNPDRKFIYVESAFFFKWWEEQSSERQAEVRELIEQGRLSFVGGAWSMNDEAASHYQSLIDQFTWGLRLLNDTFGDCGRPRTGWQIDPFGHSREQASLFAQMGYDGMFFARLDWRDKSKRLEEKKAEMIWKASANLDDSEMFTSVLYNHYSAPPGFCFDVLCSDDPFVDGAFSAENNVKDRVDTFLYFVGNMSTKYRSNNLLITMGDDFNYMDANMNFKNMDKLIKYTNARQQDTRVNVFYSTPTCYLKALHDAQLNWPAKTDDFFPYASDPHAYWTGYFTSRPTSKRYERMGNHFLQVCKQLSALGLSASETSYQDNLTYLREAIGVMQHHDAITGTEKQHVADDYARMIHTALEACGLNTNAALTNLATPSGAYKLQYQSCNRLNISECEVSETKRSFVVTLYNPLAQASDHYVRLPVSGNGYEIHDPQGHKQHSQVVPVPAPVSELKFRKSSAHEELVFKADQVPPMGFKSFYVTESNDYRREAVDELPVADETSIGNEHLTLNFNKNGFLSTIDIEKQTYRLQQDFLFYEGAYGNNEVFENRSSGAYIFRPNGTESHVGRSVLLTVVRGELVQEVHQVFNEWISQVIRVYKGEQHVEFEWLVGPIPIDDDKGKEIVTRYYSDIESSGTFWTDSNGREMVRRVRDHRETWDLELVEPVAGNYYPVTTKIALEDKQLRMAVLNDRAQGGTSMQDGVLELMVHRRLLRDDAFGVGEALNETAYGAGLIARGKHYLLFGPKTAGPKTVSLQARERFLQNQVLTPPWMFVSDASDVSYNLWKANSHNSYSALKTSLPPNVNLLTFEPWKGANSFLVRFEHLLEKNEDSRYSQPVTINLREVFSKFSISSARETTLAGNQWKADSKRLRFFFEPVPLDDEAGVAEEAGVVEEASAPHPSGMEFTLKPMEIRTFVVET